MYTFITMQQLLIVVIIFSVCIISLAVIVFKQHKIIVNEVMTCDDMDDYVPRSHFKKYCDQVAKEVSDRLDETEKEIDKKIAEVKDVYKSEKDADDSISMSKKEINKIINKKINKSVDNIKNDIDSINGDIENIIDYNNNVTESINDLVVLSSGLFDELHPDEDINDYIENVRELMESDEDED